MESIWQALTTAVRLILSFDPELYGVVFLSLKLSGVAVAIGALIGVPLGTLLALTRFPGQKVVQNLLNTLMGLPPVVAGLFVYLLLSRSGPLGPAGLLFTPSAMVAAQTILSTPIICGFTMVAIRSLDPGLRVTALALGASPSQLFWKLVAEARYGIMAAVIAGFGRVIAEVGAVMMVGGNIKGYTRVMTTAIVLETRQGEYVMALALGFVLIVTSLVVNSVLTHFQQGEPKRV
jgi:tungstate transport system permease protein